MLCTAPSRCEGQHVGECWFVPVTHLLQSQLPFQLCKEG